MRDANGPIPQIQEISSNQNNDNQRIRIQLSQKRDEENNRHANDNINNLINLE